MTDARTLTFTRDLAAPPDRILRALTEPAARMAWGPPDADTVVLIEGQPEAAPGLRETSYCGPAGNPYVTVRTDWILLDPARVTYAETLEAEGEAFATSLAIFDLAETGDGTRLDITILIASYAGLEVFAEVAAGWTHALENFAKYAESSAA
jgi:uncharacterized protein YndB with AHSA1/START domain